MEWNLRRANGPAKHHAVQFFFADKPCNVVCLQEMKIELMSRSLVVELLGPRFGDNFICLPASGTRGGILIACTQDFSISVNPLLSSVRFSVTGTIVHRTDNSSWSITGVYGPQEDVLKCEFMQELRSIQNSVQEKWMVLGDFNLISSVQDKSNTNVNLRLMGQFRALVNDLELIDYPLVGRKYTWSNERQHATLTRIDRVFVSRDWDLAFPRFQLTPASSNVSDHCPLLLSKMRRAHYNGFRFEKHWFLFDDYASVVQAAWVKPVRSLDAVRALHIRLSRTAKALKLWGKQKCRWEKFVSDVASDVIFNLDLAQESRDLSYEERSLRSFLKNKLLGIAALDRIRWRQHSRVLWLRHGDANTRLFHLRANGRRRKNHIPSLIGTTGPVTDHDSKAQILLENYKNLMGTRVITDLDLNWDALGIQRVDLSHLDEPFTMVELKKAVDELHGEKAPGPDGFIGEFYKKSWGCFSVDLLAALNQLHALKGDQWRLMNTANIALLPKKNDASDARDYRPISLMHSVAKIMCKLLAIRLAPEIKRLVSNGQSAFIRGRSIQDNFLYVKNIIKEAHSRKSPLLFLKLDIAKAFDSLDWGFLLRVLERMGFGVRWRNLISLMLASASSRILLNGRAGAPFFHQRGLRQGDPLSPLLFILAMEPLQKLFRNATLQHVLTPLTIRTARLRTSFYADDAALFINPIKQDVSTVHRILNLFGDVSGLRTSFNKCVAYPIACQGLDLNDVLQDFGGSSGTLPCQYLGLPLGVRKPRKVDVQPLFDKVTGRLKGGMGKLMTRKGRLILINSVETATATYFLTIFPAEKWMIKKFDKLRRNFLWTPDEEATGGKCLVSWKKICAPTEFGGLGVKELQAFSRSLRLRWEWFKWDDQDRPWKGTTTPCDAVDRNLFQACTEISIGNGCTAKFWHDCWLEGQAPAHIAPLLVPLAYRKNLTVRDALLNNKWMRGLKRISSEEQLDQFVEL